MDIKVSINILNYNTYEKSCVCIDSCLKQKGIDYKILLVDNASTDDSFLKLKERYVESIDYLQTGANLGYAGGNNKSIEYCANRGFEYAFLLNSDTELVGDYLLRDMVSILKQYPKCAILSPTIYDVTRTGLIKHTNDYLYNKLLRKAGILPPVNVMSDNIAMVSEAHGSALLVNCKRFLEVDGFPEHYFMYCEESTLAKKTLWAGYNILWHQSIDNYILHHHDKSKTTDPWREYLMGRNRSLEYHENCKNHGCQWKFIYKLFRIKMYIDGKRRGNMNYYYGMIKGDSISKSGYTLDECKRQGVEIRNNYNAK